MAFLDLLLLGAVAGFTIYLGLPMALLNVSPKAKGMLNAMAIGVLLFLLVDIMHDAMEDAEKGLMEAVGRSSVAEGMLFPLTLLLGIAIGLLGLVWFEGRYLKGGAGGKPDAEQAKRLALMIAIGIGLHNFSEGLAIGQSYSAGAVSLALTLVVGFGLHNMTEGFGIAAPLANHRPSRGYVALLGLIGGGPTFIGALIGSVYVSDLVSVLFLSLAGGAVIYVVKELLYHGKISGEGFATMSSLVAGFFLGFATLVMVHLSLGA
ncbi:MAG: ZIP family metal transporter [Candidatus Micrarchaeia archaeon]